jgi:L-fucose isomerase
MPPKVALATIADSRDDFYSRRQALLQEELAELGWLRSKINLIESPVIRTPGEALSFGHQAQAAGCQALVINLPIWADPILAVKLWNILPLPIMLLGNMRPDTSSVVGMLGAGGALDQSGCSHLRVFDSHSADGQRQVMAFARAAAARSGLRGQTLGLFGGRSLGILTAAADPAQWQRLFGIDIVNFDQFEIVARARSLPDDEVGRHTDWLISQVQEVRFGGLFNSSALERQVRSYLATRQLIEEYDLDFVGVKCQPEMSDGYATQCLAHMLTNGTLDGFGEKAAVVHACESDADGALTMQILHLISSGQPTSLLDIRWLDTASGRWILANCGALAATFYATSRDPQGLGQVQIMPHVFGKGGGGAYPASVAEQPVTLARLCRRDGTYWMAIVRGQTLALSREEMGRTTTQFPQAQVQSSAGIDFLQVFGSNHIHMTTGDWVDELITFCRLLDITYQAWV